MADLDFDLDSFDLETIDMGSASKKSPLNIAGNSILVNKSPAISPGPLSTASTPVNFGGGSNNVLDDLDASEFGLDMLVNKTKARKSPDLSPSSPVTINKSGPPPAEKPGFFSNLFGGGNSTSAGTSSSKPTLTAIDLDKEIADSEIGLNSTFNKAKSMNGPSLPPFVSSSSAGNPTFPASSIPQQSNNTFSSGGGDFNPGGIGDSLNMTYEEIQKAKFDLICKFERLRDKGVKVPKMFSMSSDYDEMKHEYERLVYQRKMDNSVHMQRQWLISAISGIEFLNNRYDPFDFKLDGWSAAVNEDLNKYDDIFEELYEKYQGSGSMAPELRLVFMVAGSALTHHMSMSMLKGSNLKNADDILRSDPELMAKFQAAQQATMKEQAPGFSGFMSGLFGGGGGSGRSNRNGPRDDGPPLFDAATMMGGTGQPGNNIPDLDTIINGL